MSEAIVSVDGVYLDWSSWSDCSTTCSNGTQYRERTCIEAKYSGLPCSTFGAAEEERHCNLRKCPGIYTIPST